MIVPTAEPVTWFPHGNLILVRAFLANLCDMREDSLITLYSDVIDGKGRYILEPLESSSSQIMTFQEGSGAVIFEKTTKTTAEKWQKGAEKEQAL